MLRHFILSTSACGFIIAAAAQPTRFPAADPNSSLKTPYRFDWDSGIHQSFREVVLSGMHDGSYDTAKLLIFTSAEGRLVQEEEYEYMDAGGSSGSREWEQRLASKVMKGTEKDYRYDAAGNRTAVLTYNVLPSGSAGLLNESVKARAMQEVMRGTDNETGKKLLTRVTDSLLRNPPPTARQRTDSAATTYNSAGDPQQRFGFRMLGSADYTYEHDQRGRPTVQHIRYTIGHGAAERPLRYEAHFAGYDDRDRLVSLLSYGAPADSESALLQPHRLVRAEYRHYNSAGLPDTVTYRSYSSAIRKVTAFNAAGQPVSVLLLDSGQTGAFPNTVYSCTFRYDGQGRPVRFNESYHFTKTNISYIQDYLTYDTTGRLIEVMHYSGAPEPRDLQRPLRQFLFFYGDTGDAATAARKVHPPSGIALPARPAPAAPIVDHSTSNSKHTPSSSSGEIYRFVQQMPEYPGDLSAYLSKAMRYPEAARKKGVEGRVVVQFVVEADGSISQATVARGLSAECDREAIRVISQMPAWKPGKQQGRAVRVYMNLPLTFSLHE